MGRLVAGARAQERLHYGECLAALLRGGSGEQFVHAWFARIVEQLAGTDLQSLCKRGLDFHSHPALRAFPPADLILVRALAITTHGQAISELLLS